MLSERDFLEQMQKLFVTFTEKPFSHERMRLIAFYSRDCTPVQFERVVNKIITTHRQAPLPKDFMDLIKEVLRSDDVLQDYSIYKKCDHCEGDGYVSATRTIGGREYEYSFRCPVNCEAAKNNVSPTTPVWGPAFAREYTKKNFDVPWNGKKPASITELFKAKTLE